ncbi:MAG: DNA primase catalytic subunit PriS [Thermoplasmata archaeon]
MDREAKTKHFLSRVLREHYNNVEPILPPRFTMREYAFIYMGGSGMHRPVAFDTKKEVISFLRKKTPIHSYYSTAYYSNPYAPMKDKDWLGADLVFDLDADHLPGGEELGYVEQLKLVRKKTKLLIDDFLLDDFGFDEDDITINFSGHRGYHIHVRRKDVLPMSRQARREIVDYITGKGLDHDVILPKKVLEVDRFQEFSTRAESPELPPEEEGGWRKRTRKLTIQLLKRWSSLPEGRVLEEMMQKHGIGKKTAQGLYKHLFTEGKWRLVVDEGILDIFPEKSKVKVDTFEKIIEGIIDEHNIQEVGEDIVGTTDEPVTGDTKRLIRLQNSIHAGSFLTVVTIPLDELGEFDPLEKAIPTYLSDKQYRLSFDRMPNTDSIQIGDKEFEFGDEMEVPEYAVPFLISKFKAKLL